METKLPVQQLRYMIAFKSYYVVWKPVKVHIGASLIGRLNRTMQYGNRIIDPPDAEKKEFKSYYVVWKQGYGATPADDELQFKSYYVVWKLLRWFRAGAHHLSFKSYYVVWKQLWKNTRYFARYCLNRTMQYGNLVWNGIIFCLAICLNRTMQYGNKA